MSDPLESQVASRWAFLDDAAEPCGVVSPRMEVLYLNPGARALVPPEWFGQRCWKVFPVADKRCASVCPAVRAANDAGAGVFACIEEIMIDGELVTLGVAVMPLSKQRFGERLALLFRPKPADMDETTFTEQLTASGHSFLDSIEARLGSDSADMAR